MGSVYEIGMSPYTHRVDMANYNADNRIRIGKNTKEAALVALKEYQRTEGNRRRVTAAGKEYNMHVSNLAKALEASSTTSMNYQMAAANLQGQLATQAAAAGVGGTAVDLISAATDLQRDIQLEATERERNSLSVFGSQQGADIMDNALQQLDLSQTFGNYDHTFNIEPTKLKNRWGAMIGIAVASYFGGPQAGQGAADATMAAYKAQNGKLKEASEYYQSAMKNALGGIQETKKMQDGEGYKPWFQAVRDRNNASKQAKQQASGNAGSKQNFGSESGTWSSGSWW